MHSGPSQKFQKNQANQKNPPPTSPVKPSAFYTSSSGEPKKSSSSYFSYEALGLLHLVIRRTNKQQNGSPFIYPPLCITMCGMEDNYFFVNSKNYIITKDNKKR